MQISVVGTIVTFSGIGSINNILVRSGAYQYYTEAIIQEGVTTIESGSFSECLALAKINIPSSISTISDYFFRCSSLAQFVVATNSSYFSLDSQGLLYNFNKSVLVRVPPVLTNVTLPDSIESLATGCFQRSRVANVLIPSNVTFIGQNAFNEMYLCYSISFKTVSKITTIKSQAFWYSNIGQISFPPSLEIIESNTFKSVQLTSIIFESNSQFKTFGTNVFEDTQITSFVVPQLVTSLTSNLFASCKYLVSINISKNCNSIHPTTFSGCTSLRYIHFDEENSFFSEYEGMIMDKNKTMILLILNREQVTEISFPPELTTIGVSLIQTCPSLLYINVDSGNTRFSSLNGVLYNFDKTYVIAVCGGVPTISIVSTVTQINDNAALLCSLLTSVTFLSNLTCTTIGSSAFSQCTSLSHITIPSSVKYINSYAFFKCTSLITFIIPSNSILTHIYPYAFSLSAITSIDFPSLLSYIGSYSFQSSQIRNITFHPDSPISTIDHSSFSGCSKLTSVRFSSQIQIISTLSFQSCSLLIDIYLPSDSQIHTLSPSCFLNCYSLTSFTFPRYVNLIDNRAFYSCTSLSSISFHEQTNISTISSSAFEKCTSLISFNLPLSIQSIDASTFYGCSSLISIITNSSNPKFYTQEGVLYRKSNNELILCPAGKTSIHISADVISFGLNSFYGCTLLQNITYETNCVLQYIRDFTFFQCTQLQFVEIPLNVISIGISAFSGCTALKNISFLGYNIQTIGELAFCNCTSLSSIIIPSTIRNVGEGAFFGCVNLKTVTYSFPNFFDGTDIFDNSPKIYAQILSNGGICGSIRLEISSHGCQLLYPPNTQNINEFFNMKILIMFFMYLII